jgi:hypothetical protein
MKRLEWRDWVFLCLAVLLLLLLTACASPVEPVEQCTWQWVQNAQPGTGIDSIEVGVCMTIP